MGVLRSFWLLKLGVSVMWLGASLPVAVCVPHVPPNYASYEIVIPWQVAERGGENNQDPIYVIKVEGENHVVHLKQKEIVIKTIPVFTYKHDKPQVDYYQIRDDCYYRGYVEGNVDSFVTLSTCSGLRGAFQTDTATYAIDPVEGSTLFQHLVYRMEEDKADPETCRLSGGEKPSVVADLMPEQILREQEMFHPQEHPKYLELFVQVNVNLFKRYDKDVSLTTLRVVQLIQMVDDMFFALGLRILLTGIEIWTEKNKVSAADFLKDSAVFLDRWTMKNLLWLEHDTVIVLHARSLGQIIDGYGVYGSVCAKNQVAALVSVRQVTLPHFAIAVAHEIGHVLGMPDDGSKICHCGPSHKCIMSPQGPYGKSPLFSNCSARSYFDIIQSKNAPCLNNAPETNRSFALRSCGNGIIEEEEECDCGDQEPCKRDMCCQGDCTKAEGAVCTTELCCKECGVAPEGMLCREAVGECDLPEYCSGKTTECPPNVVVQDGSPCGDDGYCYLGTCSTHTLLCQKLFGRESHRGPLSCYQAVNSIGDRFGYCGGQTNRGEPSDFKQCDAESVLCGQVQCVNVHTFPQMDEHTTILQTPGLNAVCWGLGRHAGLASRDVGAVEDGTKCGPNRVCVNGTCVLLHSLLFPNPSSCDSAINCNKRGICNSNQNCHCLYGWEPPECNIPGYGGSTDSGPSPRTGHFSPIDLYVGIGVAIVFGLAIGFLLLTVLHKWLQVSGNPWGE